MTLGHYSSEDAPRLLLGAGLFYVNIDALWELHRSEFLTKSHGTFRGHVSRKKWQSIPVPPKATMNFNRLVKAYPGSPMLSVPVNGTVFLGEFHRPTGDDKYQTLYLPIGSWHRIFHEGHEKVCFIFDQEENPRLTNGEQDKEDLRDILYQETHKGNYGSYS